MAPQIRFVQDAGGHRLAYAVDGAGPPLIAAAWWLSHVERNFQDPQFRSFFTRLAERFTVVRYDRFGTGLSDRDRTAFTLDDEVIGLEAVVDALGAERVSLFGTSCGAPTSIAYAARHPRRVDRLVLFGSYGRGCELGTPEMRAALVALLRASWGVGAKALSDMFIPDATAEEARRFAAEQVHAATGDMAARLLQLIYDADVAELVERVAAPALVLHREHDRAIGFEHGRRLAARLPCAVFAPLEGHAHLPWQGDAAAVLDAIFRYFGAEPDAPPRAEPAEAAASVPEFRRDGAVWTIRYAGRTIHLKHAKGIADLAALIASPGASISATDLAGAPDGAGARLGADPVLDRRALAGYRARLRDLDAEFAAAEAAADAGRRAGLAAEKEAVLAELRAATGLGGRARRLGDDAERARKAVGSRIRQSVAAIRAAHPVLAAHLDRALVTGSSCRYDPDRAGSGRA